MKISFYIDEDAQRLALLQALRSRNIDVIAASEVGMRARPDKDHLEYAAAHHRVLYGFNVRDYCTLHAEFLSEGRSHGGILLAKQQTYSVGEQMRRLLRIAASRSAEEMVDKIEFLSDWNDD